MPEKDSPLRLFVNSSNQTFITCPKCSFSKLVEIEVTNIPQRILKLKCKCGHAFRVQFEFRKYARKNTKLNGIFTFTYKPEDCLPVRIVNLSRGGVCFETYLPHEFKIGVKGTIRFALDDKTRTVIEKKIIVKYINSEQIGCEFIESIEYEKAFGFFLTPS